MPTNCSSRSGTCWWTARRDLTERLDQRLATAVLKDAGGLRKLLGQGGDIRNKLPAVVRSIARTTVINLMKTMDAADMMFARQRDVDSDSATLAESLASAQPRLLRCGGSQTTAGHAAPAARPTSDRWRSSMRR